MTEAQGDAVVAGLETIADLLKVANTIGVGVIFFLAVLLFFVIVGALRRS